MPSSFKVVTIEPHGFCSGVAGALRKAFHALGDHGGTVYCLHELVHNETVVRDFDVRPNGGACDVSLNIWYGPRAEPGRILLDEARTLAFSAPDAAGRYAIRAKHVFTAREKVVLNARRPIAYGGFSLRF